MAVPVIDPNTSILAYRLGEYFAYQPSATNNPTSWAATGLLRRHDDQRAERTLSRALRQWKVITT